MENKTRAPDKILYSKSDSHFNANGKALFLDAVCRKINEIKSKEGAF
jgi:hypothetical protein